MQLNDAQRKAISDHCLPSSWQQLASWRLQHQGSASDTPDVLVDWLKDASPRAQASVQELVRHISDRMWRVSLRADAPTADQAGLRALEVVCGGLRWTLWLQPQPRLRLLRISR